jgi:hypothetical protein
MRPQLYQPPPSHLVQPTTSHRSIMVALLMMVMSGARSLAMGQQTKLFWTVMPPHPCLSLWVSFRVCVARYVHLFDSGVLGKSPLHTETSCRQRPIQWCCGDCIGSVSGMETYHALSSWNK